MALLESFIARFTAEDHKSVRFSESVQYLTTSNHSKKSLK